MAIKRRKIQARITGGRTLKHDKYAEFIVEEIDSVPTDVSGSRLNYEKLAEKGGLTGNGILYSCMNIDYPNGGTSRWCYLNIYFDNKDDDYKLATEPIYNGFNKTSGATTVNFDPNDAPERAFSALFDMPKTIYVQALLNTPTDANIVVFPDDTVITIYLGYNSNRLDPPDSPTNLTISNTNVAPNSQVTLNWRGNGGQYYVSRYANGNWNDSFYNLAGTTLNVTSPSENGSYRYRVRAYNSGGYSGFSNEVELKTSFSIAGSPSNVKINNQSTLYVGTPGNTDYKLTWSAPNNGTNNTIKDYIIQRSVDNSNFSNYGNPITGTEVFVKANTTNGSSYYYRVIPRNTYGGNSSPSSSARIYSITAPSAATITSAPSNAIVTQNFQVGWSSVNSGTGYSITYKLETVSDGVTKQVYNGTNTSATVDIGPITNGSNFTLKLTTIANASGGGSTQTYHTYGTVFTKGAAISFPNKTITLRNDNGTENARLAYNKITLSWRAATTSDTFAGSIKYKIRYKTSQTGSWNDLQLFNGGSRIEYIEGTSYTVSNFGQVVSEGVEATFKVQAYQNATQAPDETLEVAVLRMTRPQIISGNIEGTITTTSVPYKFSYQYRTPSDDLQCTVSLGYNGVYDGVENITTLKVANDTIQDSLNFTLVNGETSFAAVIRELYNKVINQHYAQPDGRIRINLKSATVPACATTYDISFKYNFRTTATSGIFIAGYQQNKGYYNPEDIINLYCTPPNWTDAAGGTTGAESISYTYSGNNKERVIIRPNQISIDKASNALTDFNLVYTLQTKIKYADCEDILEASSNSIKVARWNDTDLVTLSSVTKTENTVNGFLVLPELLCASGQHPNLKKIIYTIYSNYTSQPVSAALTNVTLTREQAMQNREIRFRFEDTTGGDLSYYAIVKFINTSDREIIKNTDSYLLRSAGVPIAVRKGRVGVNVSSSNFKEENDASKNSALYVAASMGASVSTPVIEISANVDSMEPVFLNMLKGDTILGRIRYDGDFFRCDNWYYPVTQVNGKTGNVVLSAKDVNARPDDWMPTAEDVKARPDDWMPRSGTGISISGETISNSGITSLSVAEKSNTSDAYVSININGVGKFAKVFGLGSNAFNSTSYLPITGGELKGPLNGVYINAKVFGGEAIRYGDNQPSNGIKGQIWLKPKR